VRGQIRATGGGVYVVHLRDGQEVDASLRGRLKLQARSGDQVVIGDEVEAVLVEDHWVIEEVLPRRTEIVRSRFGGRTVKALVANVDRLVVVVAAIKPKPNREIIDRLLVVAESAGVEAILVVNKIDLRRGAATAEELEGVYSAIGYRVLLVSAEEGTGADEFRRSVCSGISALAGPSGVGKSHLVNAIEPTLALRTGELSRKTARGRHTTVSSRLIPLSCGGLLADTPGFSDVGVWGVHPEKLSACFPEFRPFLGKCHFRVCSHLHEPECAVREALGQGEISAGRFENYTKLWTEAEELLARERGHT
jgi:ribosome biogenesis GTPase / thiamine phosphate phosphatase